MALLLALGLAPACSAPPTSHDATRTTDVVPLAPAEPGQASPPPASPPIPPLSSTARLEDENNTVAVFRALAPSVVFVTQKRLVTNWYAGTTSEVPAGSGSGFVWSADGYIVTNFHVVDGAQSLTVTLQDTRTFEAKVVGLEPRKDIAVLKIDAPKDLLVPIKLPPKGSQLEVGQKAIAIGNPFGLDHSLTTGVISAVGRQVEGAGGVTIRDMIQTDAAINPGNSGGPLIDSAGQLIGMNTMIFSKSGQSAGIGFAVPEATIARIVPQIIKSGRADQVGIGINIDPSGRIERRLRLKGVVILAAKEGSPAAKAGLQGITQDATSINVGDVITAVDGKPVADYDGLYNALDGRKPGEKAKFTVERAGQKSRTVELDLVALDGM